MSDREAFRAAVEEYLFTERRNWKEFARALGFSREHLSKIMHGKAALPKRVVHQVIIKLAELECIHTEAQAKHLLALMNASDFSVQDWAAKPLMDLRRSVREDSNSPGGSSSATWIQTTQGEAGRGRSFWTVPFQRNPFFTGRKDILQQLQAQLAQAPIAALTQPQTISSLSPRLPGHLLGSIRYPGGLTHQLHDDRRPVAPPRHPGAGARRGRSGRETVANSTCGLASHLR